MTTIVLIAKEPLPGKAKTRLHPPLTLEQAAELAAASIDDTLAALESLPATRRILAYDGVVLPARTGNYEVMHQSGGDLDERLGAIFDACDGPTLLIGMDTPQIALHDLAEAFPWPDDVDAFFGPASDGGFWALGLAEPRGDLIRGVPMSRDDTGRIQLQRLFDAQLNVKLLPTLTDVDTIDDAHVAAAIAPNSLFASMLSHFTSLTPVSAE